MGGGVIPSSSSDSSTRSITLLDAAVADANPVGFDDGSTVDDNTGGALLTVIELGILMFPA